MEMEYKEACIELRGTREAVEEANCVIDEKYLSSIQHVLYEISKPGELLIFLFLQLLQHRWNSNTTECYRIYKIFIQEEMNMRII